ncbi:T9SS type A sorting domain-containing protein [Flavihumibacter petaseus]|uniref:Secretion system C-terminal sorting domain-containing protein n=1 Tax=Flavihumibacter petaseus NBRC 106054 TaxID=1220578 RepID=A0A0E9MXQ2_9BACT|nr:T9SS type A sorting domain-containing protein [Flavihumibacter petaseus]GAO42216.1 hypothetical protein FPE01S_01_12290 [Flavihumibacter petaseus NBRC 106054]
MRLLTQLLSVAMLCLWGQLAAQEYFPPNKPEIVPAGSPLIRLNDPASAGKGRLQLQWQLAVSKESGYIKVERSSFREGPFEVLGLVRQDSGVLQGKFLDDQPLRGVNHYRVQWVAADGQVHLSKVVTTGMEGEMSCRFYPNPVDNMLIIRSEQPLDLLISDQNGKSRFTLKLRSGLQTIDVSALEKGLYIITLTQSETGKSLTEKLVKN